MDDAELAAIRAARLQELQRNAQGGGSSSSGASSGSKENQGGNDPIQSMMSQILEPEAKERLSRVRMVKPERVAGVEQYLVRLFQSGAIRQKINEDDIVEILNKIAKDERKSNETKIVFSRKEIDEDDDDDFFD